jgi:hypothetical protein
MKAAMHQSFGFSGQRSFWLRCFLLSIGLTIALGSMPSFPQSRPDSDPFTRFESGATTKHLDAATIRFAAQCNGKVSLAEGHFAVLLAKWIPVADISKGLEDAGDVFSVAGVWRLGPKLAVELWDIEGDAGGESRAFYCLEDGKVTFAENTQWSFPVTDDDKSASWGYEQRWRIGSNGEYVLEISRFVSDRELPISRPKLEPGEGPDESWTPQIRTVKDLKLPAGMFN